MFDDADDWIDALPSDAPTPEVEAEHNEQLQALRERLCGMDQRTVDALLRGESTLDAIGKRHRISRERVRQIQRDGVAVLRRKFAQ
jgi:DNA-directed RNA polymerase sigma subunit (sigma70/sigma32)